MFRTKKSIVLPETCATIRRVVFATENALPFSVLNHAQTAENKDAPRRNMKNTATAPLERAPLIP